MGAFICGASIAAFAIQIGERIHLRSVYALAITAEAGLLLLLGLAYLLHPEALAEVLLVIVLSFVMGFQNAVTTLISRAQVRTTHVSGMATDIGVELAALVGPPHKRHDATVKLRLHSLTLTCFALGGVSGALLYGYVSHWLFLIAAAVLLIISLPEILRAQRF